MSNIKVYRDTGGKINEVSTSEGNVKVYRDSKGNINEIQVPQNRTPDTEAAVDLISSEEGKGLEGKCK